MNEALQGSKMAAECDSSAGCVHPFPAVKLRGLPFGASKEEVADFLQIVPIDIVFQERGGRPNGVAFVLCSSTDDQQQALAQDKQHLGSRYIEVFACIRTV
jgi:heterogeneous nuclear ribonucleoprotein F/H